MTDQNAESKSIPETLAQLKPIHWVLIELKNGLMKRGKFIMADKESLYINEQRTMASGLMFEGKAGQVPQMVRTSVKLADLVSCTKLAGVGSAKGSKTMKGSGRN